MSSARSKSELEEDIRRIKDELQSKQRHDEQTLKNQLIHDQTVRRLQLKRRKLLLLHILEQKLFEEVRRCRGTDDPQSLVDPFSLRVEMHEEHGHHRSTARTPQEAPRANQRAGTQAAGQFTQVRLSRPERKRSSSLLFLGCEMNSRISSIRPS